MRLLKTTSTGLGRLSKLELHELSDRAQPYAILSHTWADPKDEIQFANLLRYCDPTFREEYGYISVDLEHEMAASIKRKPA